MSYYHIVFVSVATIEFREAELLQLLAQARSLSEHHGVTGMLAYSEGRFMQVLEGEKAAVEAAYASIVVDLRHGKLEKLADGPIAQREFAGWHMGFAAAQEHHKHLPNFMPLEQLPALGSLGELLHDFLAAGQAFIR